MSTYEVRVTGTMPADMIERLGHIRAVQAAGTTLEVEVPDDAALWGLIDALRNAGIDMLELRRRSTDSAASAESGSDSASRTGSNGPIPLSR